MKMTPIKLKALRGIAAGFYRVKFMRSGRIRRSADPARPRWNVVGPESVAATSLLKAGLVAFNQETWDTTVTAAGQEALERGLG